MSPPAASHTENLSASNCRRQAPRPRGLPGRRLSRPAAPADSDSSVTSPPRPWTRPGAKAMPRRRRGKSGRKHGCVRRRAAESANIDRLKACALRHRRVPCSLSRWPSFVGIRRASSLYPTQTDTQTLTLAATAPATVTPQLTTRERDLVCALARGLGCPTGRLPPNSACPPARIPKRSG